VGVHSLFRHLAPGHDSLIQAATTSRTLRSELAIWFTARQRGNVNRLFPSWRGCFVSAGADIANDLLTKLALVHKESLFRFCPTSGRAANSVG
jgi:hypothetical protein